MNILFFLTPKAMCAYIEAGDTLRQAMERMEHSGYAALPVIDKSGKYCGVVTEGDLLSVAADQNFVPVVDDKGDFIGIVTRSRILKYCLQTGFLHE